MFKKVINPKDELNYRVDGIDNKYLINEGSRALGIFAATSGTIVPQQISPQDICFYVLEGKIEISSDDKKFEIDESELIMIPKMSAYTLSFVENAKCMTVRM